MDICRNVSVPGGLPVKCQPEMACSPPSLKLEEFFPAENTEGDDINLQWLSIFVEDCLSSTATYYSTSQYLPTPTPNQNSPLPTPKSPPTQAPKPSSLQDIVVPAKARTKRRRTTPSTHAHDQQTLLLTPSDPPLLHQAYWLADSELVFPKKEQEEEDSELVFPRKEQEEDSELVFLKNEPEDKPTTTATTARLMVVEGEEEDEEKMGKEGNLAQPRRCTHCLSHRTPQWRAGPLGPKTLCNACGVRFKSGRLLPEYRPAKSPTFVSYKHSNSHKKVLEMRMTILPSNSN